MCNLRRYCIQYRWIFSFREHLILRMSRTVNLGWVVSLVLGGGCASSETDREDYARAVQAVGSANLAASLDQTTSWGAGYCANVRLTNSGTAAASTWTVVMELN